MQRISRTSSLLISLALAALALACTPMPQKPSPSSTWTGSDTQRPFDFNSPGNWSPAGVPEQIAVVNTPAPPAPFPTPPTSITFSQPSTALFAIQLGNSLGFNIESGKAVTLSGPGVGMCCNALVVVDGNLTGNVALVDVPGQPNQQTVQGKGTITGNVDQRTGGISPGAGSPPGVLTIKGDYRLGTTGYFFAYGGQDGTPRLDVGGSATLQGQLYVLLYGDPPNPTFKILTARSLQGRFSNVVLQGGSSYKSAFANYDQNSVTVVLQR